jgi:hypothetical protein
MVYEGQWVKGKREGKGKGYLPKYKEVYEGDWKSDLFEGKGELYSEVDRYSGDFVKGKR